jgi:hypothetical protein
MSAKVPHALSLGDGRSQSAPARELDLQDPDAVETAVRAILDRHYAGSYDAALLRLGIADVFRAYRGE